MTRMKTRILELLLSKFSPFRWLIFRVMRFIAFTGTGSDECLALGFLPVPVHYYQPIPDIEDLAKRNIWDRVSPLRGVKFEPEKYLAFLADLASKYSGECEWPNEGPPGTFYLHNPAFSYGCSAPLHCIIRSVKPRRIVEIGSGFSSRIIQGAINLNNGENHVTDYVIIDPYTEFSEADLGPRGTVIRKPVETLEPEYFKILEDGDILFIDSSHVCKIGSDVNFEILDVLPLLSKGVIVHFHDVGLPNEYPRVYSTNPTFRAFWTEAYLLQAFLAFNSDFEVILPMNYLESNHLPTLERLFPASRKTNNGFVSGSFWIKRVR